MIRSTSGSEDMEMANDCNCALGYLTSPDILDRMVEVDPSKYMVNTDNMAESAVPNDSREVTTTRR